MNARSLATEISCLPDQIWRWDATDIAHHIRIGTISSYEAVASFYHRIEEKNPELNAIVHMDKQKAFMAAKKADTARIAGRGLGALGGVPLTVKLNVDVQGEATSNGVPAFKNLVAQADSNVVENLRTAGAIIIGRTNTPPFSFRWFTENPLYGRTLNPWSKNVTSGGSSGGAAVAVATGMCAIAHGTDLAGSIRYPAYVNGVVGLRTTPGRVPAYHPTTKLRYYGLQTMSSQGPLTRTVRDARLGLVALAQPAFHDTTWCDVRLGYADDETPAVVGFVEEVAGVEISPAVRSALHKAAHSLEAAGYKVEPVRTPSLAQGVRIWQSIVMTEVKLHIMAGVEKTGDPAIRKSVANMAACAPDVKLNDYIEAIALRDEYRRQWLDFFTKYSLALMPISAWSPQHWDADLGTVDQMKTLIDAQSPLIATAAAGLPGINVPTGMIDGLPVGVQLLAAPFREIQLLAAAEIVERSVVVPKAIDL